jgi:Fe2+ or Zn2+ uptake regulation protein
LKPLHGLRVSGRRLIVLEVLSAAEDRSTLREIYRRAVSRDSRVGYTTIYRTVHRLNRPWRAAPWP